MRHEKWLLMVEVFWANTKGSRNDVLTLFKPLFIIQCSEFNKFNVQNLTKQT